MQTIRYLLSKIIILIPILAVVIFLYWLASILVPTLPTKLGGVKEGRQKTEADDWLPPPGSFGALQKPKTPSATDNVYVHGSVSQAYGQDQSGSNIYYTVYDADGTMRSVKASDMYSGSTSNTTTGTQQPSNTNQTFSSTSGGYTDGSLYVRNTSLYKNGALYNGLSFTGEARGTMFSQGMFPIYMIDASGRPFGVMAAKATEQWSVPGWVRFTATVQSNVPQNTQCSLVFQAAPGSSAAASKPQVVIPLTCTGR